jgi:hypothetical protein
MISQFLKIAGVDSEEEFYAKYPSEEEFFAKCGAKIKAQGGLKLDFNAIQQANPMGMVMDTVSGLKAQKNQVDYLDQTDKVYEKFAEATMSNRLNQDYEEQQARMNNYVRHEDNLNITGEERFPIYGNNTNILSAKKGKLLKRKDGSYSQRGLWDNIRANKGSGKKPTKQMLKQEKKIKKADGGFLGMSGSQWGSLGTQALGEAGPRALEQFGIGDDMGSQIGGNILGTAGNLIAGPIGGVVGKLVGNTVGDLLDTSDKKMDRSRNNINRSMNKIMGVNNSIGMNSNFSANAKNGMNVKQAGNGSIQMLENGSLTPISENPNGSQTYQINGRLHKNGGEDMVVNGQPLEAEGKETVNILSNGDVDIQGNKLVPKGMKAGLEAFAGVKLPGSKFKNVNKSLSKYEDKQNNTIKNNVEKSENYTPLNRLDRISLNSLDLNLGIADSKLKKLETVKEGLSIIQEGLNEYDGYESQMAKYGKKAYAQDGIRKAFKHEGLNSSGLYGEAAYAGMDNFKTRNSSWFDFTDFNPENENDVLRLQRTFNRLSPENSVVEDGKFGSQTFSIDMTNPVSGLKAKGFNTQINAPDLKPVNNPYSDVVSSEEEKTGSPVLNGLGMQQFFDNSDAEQLDSRQFLPEVWAMANNDLEPVQSQKFQPRLRSPYNLSMQDQLNANTSSFNAMNRMASNNPGMASQLAAQKYNADQSVLGNQFRANQQFSDQVYRQNLQTLNDADLKNLAIADQQYTRQAQAKSNTKATDFEAIKSISDKTMKQKLESKTLAVMENLYNYRFDPSGRARYTGPAFNTDIASQASNVSAYNGTLLKKLKNFK